MLALGTANRWYLRNRELVPDFYGTAKLFRIFTVM